MRALGSQVEGPQVELVFVALDGRLWQRVLPLSRSLTAFDVSGWVQQGAQGEATPLEWPAEVCQELINCPLSIWGQIVRAGDHALKAGDRLEWTRSLILDPMRARRLRAERYPVGRRKRRPPSP